MFLEIAGAKLFYEVYGSGEPILFFHGNGEDHHYFDYQLPFFLKQGYQLIMMDTRGHGNSSYHGETLDFIRFAQDGIALLDHLQITQAHVLGFSDGANTAMQMAMLAPQRCRSLVLNGGNLHPYGMKWRVLISVYISYWKARIKHDQHQAAIINLMVHHPHITREDLAQLMMPACVLVGQYDMIKDKHSRSIAASLPHGQLYVLAQGDHFIARKQSDAFNSIVLQFFSGGNGYGK